MIEILGRICHSPTVCEFSVDAPWVARRAKPGQFLILQSEERSERVPLTIADWDDKGRVTVVVMAVGESTRAICEASSFYHIAGPLGRPSDLVDAPDEVLREKDVVFLAAGVGAAPVYPQAKYLHERGFRSHVVLAARSAELLLWEDRLREVAEVHVATDDGSRGFHGLITDALEDAIRRGVPCHHVVAIGPMIMMKFAVAKCRTLGLPVTVSLNPIMLDGTGMCGCCRCTVHGERKFACVDGPEFDGYGVDFDEALRRLSR